MLWEYIVSIQRKHGVWGEEQAVQYLLGSGFEILERNWRYRMAEVDIIGRESGILVFVEVKTRASLAFGRPEEMVTGWKKRLVIDAAMAYMRATGYTWEIRFDIVSVRGVPGQVPEIAHFRDAYFPGLDYMG